MPDTPSSPQKSADELVRRLFERPRIVLAVILALGLFARLWEYGRLPPGLNPDEASIALDAYSLLHYGVDRNGISFPVNFVSWGSGMDALYGYILLPFLALFGLSPLAVRLPDLLAGLLGLPLFYYVANKSFGRNFAMTALFLLAVSPWHIMISRWGLTESFQPFLFLAGFALLLKSRPGNAWFLAAVALFAACLYVYAAAFVAVPIFLVLAALILLREKRITPRELVVGAILFVLLALPIALFVWVNAAGMETIRLGPLTIPRLPVEARMFRVAAVSDASPLAALGSNLLTLLKLLTIAGSDGLPWNGLSPFGYLYPFGFLFVVGGVIALLRRREGRLPAENLLVLAWLAAALCIGLAQQANYNRIGLVFLPIILCAAAGLDWLAKKSSLWWALAVYVFLVSFGLFNYFYHAPAYRQDISREFNEGLLEAVAYADRYAPQPVCITDQVNMPYIYVLFAKPSDPREFLGQLEYRDARLEFRTVRRLGRFHFGMSNCPSDASTIYILLDERPGNADSYQVVEFVRFHVFVPNQ
jgi:hypothetical protein